MTKSALERKSGNWKLPQPLDVKEDGEWVPLPRIARTIPFGYKVDEDDDKILIPIESELDALVEAKKHLKTYSYREVTNWLIKRTGRQISHIGLMKRVKNERKRKNKAVILRRWAAYVEETLSKAEKIEKERLDYRADTSCGGATEEPGKA